MDTTVTSLPNGKHTVEIEIQTSGVPWRCAVVADGAMGCVLAEALRGAGMPDAESVLADVRARLAALESGS